MRRKRWYGRERKWRGYAWDKQKYLHTARTDNTFEHEVIQMKLPYISLVGENRRVGRQKRNRLERILCIWHGCLKP